jgi:hypothetical protein
MRMIIGMLLTFASTGLTYICADLVHGFEEGRIVSLKPEHCHADICTIQAYMTAA